MTTIDDEIRSAIEAFAAELSGLVRKAALETVASALTGAQAPVKAAPAAPVRRPAPAKAAPAPKAHAPAAKPVSAPRKAPAPAAKPVSKGAAKAAPKRPLGAKRPPGELAALVEKLAGYIKSNPGQGMEAISKALGQSTSDLTLPVKKLLAANRVRFEGVKRATKYYPV